MEGSEQNSGWVSKKNIILPIASIPMEMEFDESLTVIPHPSHPTAKEVRRETIFESFETFRTTNYFAHGKNQISSTGRLGFPAKIAHWYGIKRKSDVDGHICIEEVLELKGKVALPEGYTFSKDFIIQAEYRGLWLTIFHDLIMSTLFMDDRYHAGNVLLPFLAVDQQYLIVPG